MQVSLNLVLSDISGLQSQFKQNVRVNFVAANNLAASLLQPSSGNPGYLTGFDVLVSVGGGVLQKELSQSNKGTIECEGGKLESGYQGRWDQGCDDQMKQCLTGGV